MEITVKLIKELYNKLLVNNNYGYFKNLPKI